MSIRRRTAIPFTSWACGTLDGVGATEERTGSSLKYLCFSRDRLTPYRGVLQSGWCRNFACSAEAFDVRAPRRNPKRGCPLFQAHYGSVEVKAVYDTFHLAVPCDDHARDAVVDHPVRHGQLASPQLDAGHFRAHDLSYWPVRGLGKVVDPLVRVLGNEREPVHHLHVLGKRRVEELTIGNEPPEGTVLICHRNARDVVFPHHLECVAGKRVGPHGVRGAHDVFDLDVSASSSLVAHHDLLRSSDYLTRALIV